LADKNDELQRANCQLSEEQKKMSEEVASLQARLYFIYCCAVEFSGNNLRFVIVDRMFNFSV